LLVGWIFHRLKQIFGEGAIDFFKGNFKISVSEALNKANSSLNSGLILLNLKKNILLHSYNKIHPHLQILILKDSNPNNYVTAIVNISHCFLLLKLIEDTVPIFHGIMNK
jgi:hypothetical protein